jgi:pimeloyl-ACP methyl ester carboxylesterase
LNSPASNVRRKLPVARRRRPRAGTILVALLVLICLLLARPAFTGLRAAGLLLRMQDLQHAGVIGAFHTYHVEESSTDVQTPGGVIHARLYSPRGIAHPPGMLIVHGVHHLGMEDPRLVGLARAISAGGIRVLTPQLPLLADYHVDSGCIPEIGYAARSLATTLGEKVGVLGISFGGGLSLLAAADPQFEPYIRFVVSIGAHDDLARVLQFFITNQITRPDGSTLQMQAHEYGPFVLIYSHLEDFFPATDIKTARDALQQLLWENVNESKKIAEGLSLASRQKMELLYKHDVDALAGEMAESIARHAGELAPVSPHGRLQSLRVPVLLLHGAADNVIPPSELLWLEQDVPPGFLKAALASRAISHATMEEKPSLADDFHLVRFMAQMLELSDDRERLSGSPR